MLQAKKSYWFEKVFAVYNRHLLKRRFSSFQVSNFDALGRKNNNSPLIIYANHSSWWDGLVAFQISYTAALDAYVMMEEKHLRRLFLFRRLGAYSVKRENPREALQSIQYSADLLNEKPSRMLWVFPQGEILPNDLRPIVFYNGLSRIIAKTSGCRVLPVAVRYEFLGEYKPGIFVKIGKVEFIKPDKNFNIKKQSKYFAQNLTSVLDSLKSDVTSENFADYQKIL